MGRNHLTDLRKYLFKSRSREHDAQFIGHEGVHRLDIKRGPASERLENMGEDIWRRAQNAMPVERSNFLNQVLKFWQIPAISVAVAALLIIGFFQFEGAVILEQNAAFQKVAKTYEQVLDISYDRSTRVNIERKASEIAIRAENLFALFSYRHSNTIKRVVIITPMAEYTVVGTKFTLQSQPGRSLLYVAEGLVTVKRGAKKWSIGAQHTLLLAGSREHETDATVTDVTYFKSLEKSIPADSANATEKILPADSTSLERQKKIGVKDEQIKIFLKNGTVVIGAVKSADKDLITLQNDLAPNSLIPIKRADIIRIENNSSTR